MRAEVLLLSNDEDDEEEVDTSDIVESLSHSLKRSSSARLWGFIAVELRENEQGDVGGEVDSPVCMKSVSDRDVKGVDLLCRRKAPDVVALRGFVVLTFVMRGGCSSDDWSGAKLPLLRLCCIKDREAPRGRRRTSDSVDETSSSTDSLRYSPPSFLSSRSAGLPKGIAPMLHMLPFERLGDVRTRLCCPLLNACSASLTRVRSDWGKSSMKRRQHGSSPHDALCSP